MRREPLSAGLRYFFETGEYGHPDPAHHGFGDGVLEALMLRREGRAARWPAERDDLLAAWVTARPGTRPWAWWTFDAPEPRRRLGGVGTPEAEVLAVVDEGRFGIPAYWVGAWAVARYGPGFRGRAIDPADPPRYESQAAYLDRLGLLSPEERLSLPPDAFEPEVIRPDEEGPDEEHPDEEKEA